MNPATKNASVAKSPEAIRRPPIRSTEPVPAPAAGVGGAAGCEGAGWEGAGGAGVPYGTGGCGGCGVGIGR